MTCFKKDADTQHLRITIVGATGLKKADIGSKRKSDPYCILKVSDKPTREFSYEVRTLSYKLTTEKSEFRTPVSKNTLNPQWDYTATISAYFPGDFLKFQIMDKDWALWRKKPDDFLGETTLRISKVLNDGGFNGELELTSAGKGSGALLHVKVEVVTTEVHGGWATCMETCTPGHHDGDTGTWSCQKVGNRTKLPVGCSWSGEDCSDTHCCNNDGFTCAKKDAYFAGCVQTLQKSTWFGKAMPIPSDWEGTVYGYGRHEYACKPAAEGHNAGASLYCFMAIMPHSTEGALKEVAKKNNASIYACEEHDVFLSRSSANNQWDTAEATLANTNVFIDVWQTMEKTGKYLNHDWTVKVDADCVFLPDRLRSHILMLKPPAYTPVYMKNNGVDPGLGNNGFLGAIEVFSKRAVQLYFDNQAGCVKSFAGPSGEDGYFKGCMDALGVCFTSDVNMFHPDYDPGACSKGQHVAFHPLKDPKDWQCCLDIAHGKQRAHAYGHCS
jgi:hypothetical protein